MAKENGHATGILNLKTGPINLVTKTQQVFFYDLDTLTAQLWLKNHNMINRPQRYSSIEKYMRDHVAERWPLTHEGMAFDYNGQMIDGQHRAEMVVQSGKPLRTIVVLGLDPGARMVVNIGIPRRPHDVLRLIGFEDASPWSTAIVRQMINSINRRATLPEIVEAYKKYEKRAKIVMAMFPFKKAKLTMSPMCAVMARALETWEEADILTFSEILFDGMGRRGRKGDVPVCLLHDWLITLPAIGGNADRAVYGMTQTALYAFLNNEKVSPLVPSKEELFPMKGDAKLRPVEVIKTKRVAELAA